MPRRRAQRDRRRCLGGTRISGRLFGLDVPGNPQAPYLARLFGARDAALAYGVQSTQGPHAPSG